MITADELEYERQLVAAAKADSSHFTELYERYVDRIYSYVFHRTHSEDATEDIVSQTFFKVVEHLPKFEWKGYSICSWIYRIATNEINQFYRNQKKTSYVDLDDVAHVLTDKWTPQEDFQQQEVHRCLHDFLGLLPESQKQVLLLRFVEGLSNTEIAFILNKKEGAVRQLIFRALQGLRTLLDDTQQRKKKPTAKGGNVIFRLRELFVSPP
jgi:RNA polymerase sigma-70 factor (ECF subfamily)